MSEPQRSRKRKNPLVNLNISHSGSVPYEEESVAAKKFVCKICDISCISKRKLKQHKQTNRHQKRQNKLKQDQEKRDVDILVGNMSSVLTENGLAHL